MINHSRFKRNNDPANKNKVWIIIGLTVLTIIFLAITSFSMTAGIWDGYYPSGEYHLSIRDQKGSPIEGAVLNIYQDTFSRPAFNYPFENYHSYNNLISDEEGEIIIIHFPSGGFEVGGTFWNLFWLIPINRPYSRYLCQITSRGYSVVRFSADRLFDLASDSENVPTVTLESNGRIFDMPVYRKTIVLKKK